MGVQEAVRELAGRANLRRRRRRRRKRLQHLRLRGGVTLPEVEAAEPHPVIVGAPTRFLLDLHENLHMSALKHRNVRTSVMDIPWYNDDDGQTSHPMRSGAAVLRCLTTVLRCLTTALLNDRVA